MRATLEEMKSADPLILDFPPPEQWENKLLFKPPVWGILLWQS